MAASSPSSSSSTSSSSSSSSLPSSPSSIVCHTRLNWSPELSFEWVIHDFENLFQTLGVGPGREQSLISDSSSAPGKTAATSKTFQVKCLRQDNDKKTSDVGEFIGVYVLMPGLKENTKLNYSVGVKDKDGALWGKVVVAYLFEVGSPGYGWPKAFSLAELKANRDKLMPDGNLTLVCNLTLLQSGFTHEIDHPGLDNARTLTEDLSELLRANPETADVIFICRNKEFSCHKTVLSARSPVFKAMFAHKGFEEDTSGSVLVEDFTPGVVEVMVKAMYSDNVSDVIKGARGNDGGDLVCDLFRAAEKYEIKSLKVACEKILIATLDLDNCARIMHWALACNGDALAEMARKFIEENIGKILSTAAFRDLMAAFPDAMLKQGEKTGKKKRRQTGLDKPGPTSKKKKA